MIGTWNLIIICFTVIICVAMVTSTIDKAVGKHDSSKNRND